LTKAKMPVAKHHTLRASKARAGQVWTEELTISMAGADCVDPSGCNHCRSSLGLIGWGTP